MSALLSKHNDSATVKVIEKNLWGEVILLYSEEILNEYREVLSRKKFSFSFTNVSRMIESIISFGELITPTETGEILIDMKDLPFYKVSMRKKDPAYLVTGNKKHFPNKNFIVTPNELLEILEGK